ncbi:hypothetical protein BTVI_108162 [Pitangus sulphuratus]|nr:hypothetical protein BTVI_108162 [Pitangus sulphuratus]
MCVSWLGAGGYIGSAIWSPMQRIADAIEAQGESSQVADLKAFQMALGVAEQEKWPALNIYTDSWMAANALWELLDRLSDPSGLLDYGKASLPG